MSSSAYAKVVKLSELKSARDSLDLDVEGEILGKGVTGSVFASDDPKRAIKLCRAAKPYVGFVDFARGLDNPHVPTIYDVRFGKRRRMRVEMERLQPLEPRTADWATINTFANICHAVTEGRPVADTADFGDALNDLAWALGRFARTNRFALDLQCANIMQRAETGEIVFTDPLR